MKIVHLVKIVFDRRTERATQEWLDRRFLFFRDHTLRSLLGQRFNDWRLWLCCSAGMENMVDGLREVCPAGSIFTFSQDDPVPCEAVGDGDERLRFMDCDHVYVTRVDSDDLLAPDALEQVNLVTPKVAGRTEAALFRRGYVHDVRTGKLGVYNNPSGPFHTLMVPRDVFLNREQYRKLDYGDHSLVAARYPCQGLPDWRFTVLIHGDNFLSTAAYSSEPYEFVERGWSVDRFLAQPVVFDVDDQCDQHDALPELDRLRARYPHFRATVFAIPQKCSKGMIKFLAARRDWLEVAVHGVTHEPTEELRRLSGPALGGYLRGMDWSVWSKGFRPPGWYLSSDGIKACNEHGLWVALHSRDRRDLGPLCKHGWHACDDRLPSSHHHSHDVCGNWIRKDLPKLLERWPTEQRFLQVGEAIVVPQQRRGT